MSMLNRNSKYDKIYVAAEWLKTTPQHQLPQPLNHEVQKLFDLSVEEAAAAIKGARLG